VASNTVRLSYSWFSLIFVLFAALGLGACKTPRQKDDTIVLVEPSAPEPVVEAPATASASLGAPEPEPEPQRVTTPFSEPLPPVRGGARVLPPYRGPDPCKMALLGESPVARVCSKRGVRGAVELMQSFVRRAKAEGITFTCTDCHVDEDDYMNLRPEADAEFRKLLFLARPDD
jgi:hypothetical protein